MKHTSTMWILRYGLVFAICTIANAVAAQGVSVPTVSDVQVGYIDGAVPGNQLRMRADLGYSFFQATRAEFFYAKTGPGAPGLPRAERSIDFQAFHLYGELLVLDRVSSFVELPIRFLNPEINENAGGIGDMNIGAKWAFLYRQGFVASLQFRTYIPTGAASRGLGTNNVSLEPALLWYRQLGRRSALEGEFRYLAPIGGTDFAGDILRYGLGIHCDICNNERFRLSPVLEFVGWTVLGGKSNVSFPNGTSDIVPAAGDTMIYAKFGLRTGFGENVDFFAGYGRPLTGERWYNDVVRLEMRLRF